MSWHDLNDGVEYELEDIISILERRVSTGGGLIMLMKRKNALKK